MDASLHQTQSQRQQQMLAPQMRQSLEILQAPLQELQALIARELELNPVLELEEPAHERLEIEPGTRGELDEVGEREFEEEYQLLAKLDDDNRDSFHRNEILRQPSADAEGRRQFMLESLTAPLTLQQHLQDQLSLSGLSGIDRQIGEMIIGNLNADGYLTPPLEELAQSIGVETARVERVLAVVREFDPTGIASRSLSDCLLCQLERAGRGESLEADIARHHLSDLARHRYADIARERGVSEWQVREAAAHIAQLDPRPGRQFGGEETIYVVPEIFVRKSRGRWIVRTNDRELPRIHISPHYRKMMEDPATGKEARSYIRDKIRGGGFLMRSLGQRQETLQRIAHEVVSHQEAFLEKGVEHLKPLTMSEIAERLGIHETTVSRAVNHKYMQTPRGTFELKYFFTPGYTRAGDGEAVSNKSIKEAIRRLVGEENPNKPLSDQAMVAALKALGFQVARRTIAKYRDELHILPSHLRKT